MEVYHSFPGDALCPVCGNNHSAQTILIPVDNTEKSSHTLDKIPVHLLCILGNIRYSRHHQLMGLEATKEK